ncbi:hypothetical protein ACQ4PT_032606 [Festuca glaucescens]
MKKPSNINPSYNMDVILDLDIPSSHCLQIMRKICHPNILRLEGYVASKSDKIPGVFLEPLSGRLFDYLMTRFSLVSKLDIVPSQGFQHIVRQIVNGLAELAANGEYHGNLRLKNTYYQIVEGDFVVKLAGFTRKDLTTVDEGLMLDLNGLGLELEVILNRIRSENRQYQDVLLQDLVDKLKSFTLELVPNFREKVLDYVFFWDKKKRTAFFTCTVPKSLNDPKIQNKVIQFHNCNIPWDSSPFHGLKDAMNAYQWRKFKSKYNGKDKVHHFRFASGAYTHEEQIQDALPNNLSVDDIIQLCDLMIFLEAHRLLS